MICKYEKKMSNNVGTVCAMRGNSGASAIAQLRIRGGAYFMAHCTSQAKLLRNYGFGVEPNSTCTVPCNQTHLRLPFHWRSILPVLA